MENKDLAEFYNKDYTNDAKPRHSRDSDEGEVILKMMGSWRGLKVLEVGCGTGGLALDIAKKGADVTAIDYAEEGINKAKEFNVPNPEFIHRSAYDEKGVYDVIVMQGVLEHMDKPYELLKSLIDNNLADNGTMITSSPSFLNPRGYVWMFIHFFHHINMAGTDLHHINPWDIGRVCIANNWHVECKSSDYDRASGEKTIAELAVRFKNELYDDVISKHDFVCFLSWLKLAMEAFTPNELSGMNIVYKIQKGVGHGINSGDRDKP